MMVCLGEPERLFNELWSTLSEFGKLSGYKVNISKAQVMSLHFVAPKTLRKKFEINCETVSIKYLGINLTRVPSELFRANYEPISLSIKADLHRCSLVPFLSLSSQISAVKMNILPHSTFLGSAH